MEDITIHLLADHPEHIGAVGEMRWLEWGVEPGLPDLSAWITVTANESCRLALPITWVAVDENGTAVGAVGLAKIDLAGLTDRSPWLIGMIVSPPSRGRGIGAALVSALETWAGAHGFGPIWVATAGRAVGFYRKCGWEFFEVLHHDSGESTTILRRTL